jgi:hypothetical protein
MARTTWRHRRRASLACAVGNPCAPCLFKARPSLHARSSLASPACAARRRGSEPPAQLRRRRLIRCARTPSGRVVHTRSCAVSRCVQGAPSRREPATRAPPPDAGDLRRRPVSLDLHPRWASSRARLNLLCPMRCSVELLAVWEHWCPASQCSLFAHMCSDPEEEEASLATKPLSNPVTLN